MSAPILACILIGTVVPESPIWLLQKDLYQLAESVIMFLGRNEEEFTHEVSIVRDNTRHNILCFLFSITTKNTAEYLLATRDQHTST